MNPQPPIDPRVRSEVESEVSRWVTWTEKSKSGIAVPLKISAVLIVLAAIPLAIIWWVVHKVTQTELPACDGKAMKPGDVCMLFGRNGGTKTYDEMIHPPSTVAPVVGWVLTAIIVGLVLLIIAISFWVNSGGRGAELGEALTFGENYLAYRDELVAQISAAPHDQVLRSRLAVLDEEVARTAQRNAFAINGRVVSMNGGA